MAFTEYDDDDTPKRRRSRLDCCDGYCGALDCYTCRGEEAIAFREAEAAQEEKEANE